MKLFTVGPVQMDKKIINANKKGIPYFRNQEFSDKMISIEKELLRLFNADNHKSVILTSSGTGALESVVCSLPKDKKVLIINGGTFGQRFVEICKLHKIKYDELIVGLNEDLTNESFEKYKGKKYYALLCNIHETSIGKLYDKQVISEFCKKEKCFLIVDSISSAFADEYDLKKFKADVTILSSQKALALAPGISILILSNQYIKQIKKNESDCYYLDIKSHLLNMERGQTPFTPGLAEIEQLYIRLKTIKNYKDEVNKTESLARYFRENIKLMGFEIPKYNLSNCLTPIICKNNDAKDILEYLKSKGLYVNPCGGSNADTMLRIGHIGCLTKKDIDKLLKAIRSYV